MEFVHQCGFCDWKQAAASPTLVAPRCPDCGCLICARRRNEHDEAASASQLVWTQDLARLVSVGSRVMTALAVLAAARAGYVMGGTWIAMVALGITVLAALPVLVPERKPVAE